jgi:hypothetical protein
MKYIPNDDDALIDDDRAGWSTAYRHFLMARNESIALKIAPLILIGILPPELMSNFIPGLGLLDDYGYMIIAVFVVYKTVTRVQRYRY